MRPIFGSLLLTSLMLTSACSKADKLPLEISVGDTQGVPTIFVTSVADKVKLQGYTINRGNCTGRSVYQMPVDILFGGELKIFANGGCNIREVTLTTDTGEITYSN